MGSSLTHGFARNVTGFIVGFLALAYTVPLYSQDQGSVFLSAGSMSVARAHHTATSLPNGQILIVGGSDQCESRTQSTAELFDPPSGRFVSAGNLGVSREWHTATLLDDGKVLIAGGNNENQVHRSAVIYDPAKGTFGATGNMDEPRTQHTATLLPDGRVVIAGGSDGQKDLDSVEIYDPVEGTFSKPDARSSFARALHAAAILPDGRVLIVGGRDRTNEAEVFDPQTETFEPAGRLAWQRGNPTATPLLDGRVLVVGGQDPSLVPPYVQAEIYNPGAGSFSTVQSTTPREGHTATLLPDGRVLIAGGVRRSTEALVFDPASSKFAATGGMTVFWRGFHAAAPLADGRVLITGGLDDSGTALSCLQSADFYGLVTSPTCSYAPRNIFLNYIGNSSGCTFTSPFCSENETIQFRIETYQYTIQECDTFEWNFGDGTFGSGVGPKHTYKKGGTYTVLLSTSNQYGVHMTGPHKITVATGCAPVPDTIQIDYSGGTSGCGPNLPDPCLTDEPIRFAPVTPGYALQPCDTIGWTFGDGTTSSATNPVKIYSAPRSYNVFLRLTNPNGARTASRAIEVGNVAVDSFAASPSIARSGEPVTLSWATHGAKSISIDHGVGAVDSSGSAVVRPMQTTRYEIRAETAGVTATRNLNVTVTPPPAHVIVSSLPSPLLQTPNIANGATSFVLTNDGGQPTSVTLDQSGDFFTQSPASFSLDPGESGTVSISGLPRDAGTYGGASIISGAGVPEGLAVRVRMLVAVAPSIEPGAAAESDVDLSAPPDQNTLRGSVTFLNTGNVALSGVVESDVSWIIPDEPFLQIEAQQSGTVDFTVDRDKRPDAGTPGGTLTGRLTLFFPAGGGADVITTGRASARVRDTPQLPFAAASAQTALRTDEVALIVPGIGRAKSSIGTFVTDAVFTNRSSADLTGLLLLYTSSNGTIRQAVLPRITASQPLTYRDIIKTNLQLEQDLGSLTVRLKKIDAEKLDISTITYLNDNPRGSYGSAIPMLSSETAVEPGASMFVTGLRSEPGISNTNFVFQEMTGHSTSVEIDFYDSDGAVVGTKLFEKLEPFQTVRRNDFVPPGAVSVVLTNVKGSSGRFLAFATPVDRTPENDGSIIGGDTWVVTDWSRVMRYPADGAVFVPVIGRVLGGNNTFFRSDVSIMAAGSDGARATATFISRDGTSIERVINLKANGALVADDVLSSLFDLTTGLGFLTVEPQVGTLSVSSRTYATQGMQQATFGTGAPSLSINRGLMLGDPPARIGGLEEAADSRVLQAEGRTFRTNFGFMELSGAPVTVRVTLRYQPPAVGPSIPLSRSKDYALSPNQFMQLSRVAMEMLGEERAQLGDLDNLQIEFEVVAGEGTVGVYTASVDNGTGDQILKTVLPVRN